MSKGKIKVIAITLLTLFVVTFAWANYTNSRGLTFDNSGNLLVANGGILAYINSYGFPLDSSGNILVNCASGCGGAGAFADPGSNGTMFRSALNTATVVNGSAVNQIYVAGTSGTGTPSFKSIGDLTPGTYVVGGGTAQAQTATFVPPVTALSAGLQLQFLPTAANTAAAPTLAANGLTATAITKCGTTPLVAGDITTGQPAEVVYDGTEFVLSNPLMGCSQANSGFLSNGYGGTGAAGAISANNGKLWSFSVKAPIVASTKLVYGIQTLDNSANVYNIAIMDSAKNILCQTGAVAGTTFSPSTGVNKTLSWTAPCSPLIPGTQYYFLFTGNAATAVLDGLAATEDNVCNVTSGATTSASGVITAANVGIPANSLTNCTYPNFGIF